MIRIIRIGQSAFAAGILVLGSCAAWSVPRPAAHKLPQLPKSPNTRSKRMSSMSAAADDLVLYNGSLTNKVKTSLASWGGGYAEDSQEMPYMNGHAIKITTHNYYEGGRLTFDPPADLSSKTGGANRIVVITLRLATPSDDQALNRIPTPKTASAPTGSTFGAPSLFHTAEYEGGGVLRLAQAGGPADPPWLQNVPPSARAQILQRLRHQLPPTSATPAPDNPAQGARPAVPHDTGPQDVAIKSLRLLFTFANGVQADILRAIPIRNQDGGYDVDDWLDVAVPLKSLKLAEGTPLTLQSLTLGGDGNGAFFIGRIKVVTDDKPITCSAGGPQFVSKGDQVDLHATADGGASTLKYSWDFDGSDGVTEQASGPDVTTQYFKGNRDYTVTLTVSDVDGIKKTATSTTVIHVED